MMHILFCLFQFLLDDFSLDSEIGQLVAQPLGIYAQRLPFLFAYFDLLLHHDGSLYCHAVFGFHVFQRRLGIPLLALKIIIGHFNVAEPHLKRSICVS